MTLLRSASHLSLSLTHIKTSIILLGCTLINTLCLPVSLFLIHLSIHHPCWPAQVITHCDDGFVSLITLIIVVTYNLVLCRDIVIPVCLYLTLAIECAHVCDTSVPMADLNTNLHSWHPFLRFSMTFFLFHFVLLVFHCFFNTSPIYSLFGLKLSIWGERSVI